MRELRRIASQGIPDTAGIRSTVWKVNSLSLSLTVWRSKYVFDCFLRLVGCFLLQLLLGYLPLDRSLWPSEMAKKRSQYKQFKDELLMNPVCCCFEQLLSFYTCIFCFFIYLR